MEVGHWGMPLMLFLVTRSLRTLFHVCLDKISASLCFCHQAVLTKQPCDELKNHEQLQLPCLVITLEYNNIPEVISVSVIMKMQHINIMIITTFDHKCYYLKGYLIVDNT